MQYFMAFQIQKLIKFCVLYSIHETLIVCYFFRCEKKVLLIDLAQGYQYYTDVCYLRLFYVYKMHSQKQKATKETPPEIYWGRQSFCVFHVIID